MAVAITTTSIGTEASAEARAAGRTALGALLAVAITAPLVMMLLGPVSRMMFVRGTAYDGDWSRALIVTMIPVAPMMYTLFWSLTLDLLKNKVPAQVRKMTLTVGALGILPYAVIAGTGYAIDSLNLKVLGMVTIPLAIAATIYTSYTSTRNH